MLYLQLNYISTAYQIKAFYFLRFWIQLKFLKLKLTNQYSNFLIIRLHIFYLWASIALKT
jgi:hypothetical protein